MEEDNSKSKNEYRYLALVAGIFVASILIANTTASKLFQVWQFVFPAGIIVFPISYIFGDILTEVYGYVRARRIIWTGFAASILMALVYWAAIQIPPAPFWEGQEAFAFVLGQVPRIVLASILGYLVGEFLNSFVLAKMKIWSKGRYLWTRTVGSSVVGQGADTIVFIAVAFGGTIPGALLLTTMVSVYVFKVLYEIAATPVTYMVVNFLKKQEGIDYYDTETNFSPLRWKE